MFAKNHLHFEYKDHPFVPCIYKGSSQEIPKSYNCALIHLPSHMDGDLDWESQIKRGEELLEQNKKILWHLDFELENLNFPYDHKLQFESLKLAVEAFSSTIYPKFSEETLGVLLYSGELETVLSSFGPTNSLEQILQTVEIFVDFLRLFFPVFPDDILPFLDISTSQFDQAFVYQLFSKERFEYFSLITEKKDLFTSSLSSDSTPLSLGYMGENYTDEDKILPTVGLLFPQDDLFADVHLEINSTLKKIVSIPTRIIYESFLIDEIDGIDQLIVFEKGLTPSGKRQIQGFLAAGGQVVTVGEEIGFLEEISFEVFLKNRGRGIRTPDLLVPNQPR